MGTLAEIKDAANKLPTAQKIELMLSLAQACRKNRASLPTPREFPKEQLEAWMDLDEEAMRRFNAAKHS